MSRLQSALWDQLIAEFPPLWNPQDLCFRDLHVRKQCRQLLLEKANLVSSVPITMESLRKRLRNVNKQLRNGRYRHSLGSENSLLTSSQPSQPTSTNPDSTQPVLGRVCLRELAADYPCLWDSHDVNYMNALMKTNCEEQLLVKYNNLSSTPITMSQLQAKLQDLRQQRDGGRAAAPRGEDARVDWQSDLGNSSDSTDQANLNNQTAVLSIVFHCCAVCGEVKSECLNHTDESYIENNKITLSMNNLSVELKFDKDANICQNCDTKLKEMHEFVKLVKNAQVKINGVNVADVIAIDDENDDQKLIIDSLTDTDTELVKPTDSHKRKGEDTPELKKKCRVTIDLNSCDDDKSTMDDIAKYQMFKNEGILMESNDADKVSKVIDTADGEDIIFQIKEEIETDDIHEEVDGILEMSSDDDKSNIVSAHTRDGEDVIKQTKADDKQKEKTSKRVTEEEERNDNDGNGEVVAKEDIRNGIMQEHTNETETSAAVSIVNALASKEPVCVMPKSELIGLVESIVSRMLTK